MKSFWLKYKKLILIGIALDRGHIKSIDDKGRYNDQQIVSAQWIEEMTHPKTVESDRFRGMDYGYLWWIIDREKKIYSAIGNSGNVIYINPEQNIVVAVASYFKPTVFDRVDFIMEHIEPFISSL